MAEPAIDGGVVDEPASVKPTVLEDDAVEPSSNAAADERAVDTEKPAAPARERTSESGGSLSASPTDAFETAFYKMLVNPLLEQLEESVSRNNEILDEIMIKMKEEREQMRKRQMSAHIPLALQGKGRNLLETVQHVENFIEFENYDPEVTDSSKLIKSSLRQIDKSAEIAIVSHSLAAFMSTLDSPHLKHLATKIVTDVTSWIGKLFQFTDAAVYFHEEEKEGLAKICQLALHRKYPKYAADGYEVLYPRPPVIYVSAAAKPNVGQYLCHQLGLPLSCICTVPCDVSRMDLVALQKLVEDDTNSGKTPVIVIAQAGAPLTGQTDNLTRLHEICRLHDLWLHVEGCGLSMLAAPSVPPHLVPASLANSATLHVGIWLALPAVPFVLDVHPARLATVGNRAFNVAAARLWNRLPPENTADQTLFQFRRRLMTSPDIVLSRMVGLSTFNVRYKLNCLSLWMCLLHLGHDNVVARLMYYAGLAKMVHERLLQIPTSNELIVLDLESPVVIARYQAKDDKHSASQEVGRDFSGVNGEKLAESRSPYFDTLNIWLAEALKREVPEFLVSAVEVPKYGLCIRYSPLDVSDMFEMSHQLIGGFLDCLERHVRILDATVAVKKDFADIVESQDNLGLVHLPTWAGLGAVQYVPEAWRDKMDNLPEIGRSEINVLNQEMVSRLKSTDTAFSLGVTQGGLYCIRFGLVTADTDLEELIGMVVAAGKEIEESSKYLESMAEIVRQGIEKAAADLEKENQDKLLQAGVLRQVPLVGSLLNWWSPPPNDPIKGRCFNLASGKIASTEATYKYHMQIQEDPVDMGTKFRDVPLKTLLKPVKSRLSDSGPLQVNPPSSSTETQQMSSTEEQQQQQPTVNSDGSSVAGLTDSALAATSLPQEENDESVDVK